MDAIDIKITLLLIVNSRLSYREISDYLGLSVNAIYKRVQNMVDLGIIKDFKANISPYAVNAIYTLIFGESNASNTTEIAENIGNHKNTYNVMLSSRNQIYVGALLKDIHKMGDYTSYISKVTGIQSPKVGLLHHVFYDSPLRYVVPRFTNLNLDELNLSIIRSLHKDSRKPISEIAEDVNSTANTVRRRLKTMMEEGTLDLTINFHPDSSNDIFTLFQLTLSPTQNKDKFAQYLVEKYKPHLYFCWTFSNLPNFLLCYVWTNTMKELNDLIELVKKDNIENLLPDIVYKGFFFDTWKEKLLYQ